MLSCLNCLYLVIASLGMLSLPRTMYHPMQGTATSCTACYLMYMYMYCMLPHVHVHVLHATSCTCTCTELLLTTRVPVSVRVQTGAS